MATTKQNQMIAGRFVESQDGFSKLPNDDAQWLIQNTREAIERCIIPAVIDYRKAISQTAVPVLGDIISTTLIFGRAKKFIAKDKFIVDTSKKAKVKISFIGIPYDDFIKQFLGKIEEPFTGSAVYGREIKIDSYDEDILSELGGPEEAATTLTEVYAMMQNQSNHEDGPLLTNRSSNIFYIHDIKGKLWAVVLYWNDGGWTLGAYSTTLKAVKWGLGHRVFSHRYSRRGKQI